MKWMRVARVLAAGVIVAVTIGNIILDVAAEPLWHKLLVIFVMAPLVAVVAAQVRPAANAEAEPATS